MGPNSAAAISAREKNAAKAEEKSSKTVSVKVERSTDPVWDARGRKLYEFLEEPKTWDELKRWAIGQRLGVERLRHVIAHIDPLVKVIKGKDRVRKWVRFNVYRKEEADQEERNSSRSSVKASPMVDLRDEE